MKFIISTFFILSVLALGSLVAAKVCVIRATNCNSNVNVCGRYGKSDLCKRFQNMCDFESANCKDNAGYTAVNATLCTGIALNQRRMCYGVSTTGLGGSNIIVQPIVIKTGK
ncbi:uncharacterized protein [Musca autumnalis]|uniref:uncharacterized protein n=1 Tax=Musca autumnalis TaxID=221902 RepID=UPI003CF8C436